MSESPPVDRRQGDRRAGGQGNVSRPATEESWFGALGVEPDTEMLRDAADTDNAARLQGGLNEGAPRAADGRMRSSEVRRIAATHDNSALRRIFRTYLAARAALGMALVLTPWSALALGARAQPAVIFVCVAYAAQAMTLWLLPRLRGRRTEAPVAHLSRRRWLATIGIDIVAFAALHLLEPISNLNYAALLVLPVLMAGVMTARTLALATASGVAMLLLLGVWRAAAAGGDGAVLLTQAGLAGIGLFAITLLAGELAGRLAREELAARGSMELARQQAQLNRLVIEEMADGVLVVDRGARVRAANPAARSLLASTGMAVPAPFHLQDLPAWAALRASVERAFADGLWPDDAQEIRLEFDNGDTRTLQVRARFTRRRPGEVDSAPPEELCVLFLEDSRSAQTRMRQDKLAAMGRVSAGIAHEIRNPLAAIAQANALMMEDDLAPPQRRLAEMVSDNVGRLKRIVDDVMEVAPGAAPEARAIDATAQVAQLCADWARTAQMPLGPDGRLAVELPSQALGVWFEPEHLRRVLVNLLDNAHRHASAAPRAIALRLAAFDENDALLVVASDGAPIQPEVERHLFEPFFSTRSRGTGLGLYICRELCERYGASIEYRLRPAGDRHRNEFRLSIRRSPLPETETQHLL